MRAGIGIAVLLLGNGEPPAYDQTGHETVLYAVARRLNLPPHEAAILAHASQSLDEHEATTAFSAAKAYAELKDMLALKLALKDAPHMISGQMFHALTEHRAEVEREHHSRIRRATDQGNRPLALFYMGQYLHFVADEVAHPTDPFWGHFLERHHPDRGEENPGQLRVMMALIREKLVEFEADGVPRETEDGKIERWKKAPPALEDVVLEKVVETVADSWVPRASSQRLAAVQSGSAANVLDYDAMFEREKTAIARARIMLVLSEAQGFSERLEPRVIPLDENGDPPLGTFGFKRDIDVLPFSQVVGELKSLREERERQAEKIKAEAAAHVQEAAARSAEMAAGPGGVALDPGLDLPGGLGEYRQITLRPEGVALETSTGTYLIEGITPQSFATILRCVAGGDIPFVTIGTDPSDRPGYARVTYAPSLRGTAEGALLYRADVQFKALFAGYPLGDRMDLNIPGDPVMTGFPGSGGESIRLWITCSNLRLEREGDRLRGVRHGMRINSETMLRGDVAADPRMDAYVRKLTEAWSDLAERIVEFKAMEGLALECALALWARRHQVPVHEFIWSLPPAPAHTPGYAPVVLSMGERPGICGGVTLTPEEEGSAPGKMFLRMMGGASWSAALWGLLVLAALVLVPAVALRALLRRASGEKTAFAPAVKAWGGAVVAQGLLSLAAWPLVTSRGLAAADRDFVAFLWLAMSPVVFAIALRAAGLLDAKARARGIVRSLIGGLGLGLPLAAAWAGLLIALLTAAATGRMPTPGVERLITLELAPANTLGTATVCFVRSGSSEPIFVPAPLSIQLAQHEFTLPPPPRPEDAGDVVEGDGRDPFMPWTRLRRAAAGSGGAIYTIDGELPYAPGN